MSEWQPAPGWEDHYEVNRFGEVRQRKTLRLVGQWPNGDGYLLVRLSRPRRLVRVHRLVAKAFVSNPDGKPHVNHIDHNRANNQADNLEWCTQGENLAHMTNHGRRVGFWSGKRSPSASLLDAEVHAIRRLRESGRTLDSIAAQFEISKKTVLNIIHRRTYANVQ